MSQPNAGSVYGAESFDDSGRRESVGRGFGQRGATPAERLQRILAELATQSGGDTASIDLAKNLAAIASLANWPADAKRPDDRQRPGGETSDAAAASEMRRDAEWETYAELSQTLGELETRLRQRAGNDGGGSLRAALRELEARLQMFASRQISASQSPATPDPAATAAKTPAGHTPTDGTTQDAETTRKREILVNSRVDAGAFARMQQQTEEIRDLLTSVAGRPLATDKIEAQLDALTRKAEEAIARAPEPRHYDALSQHIEASHRQMAAQFEAGLAAASAETGGLKDLVQMLAEKIESARDLKASDQALELLRREMATIVKRLDGAEPGFASLTSLEPSIAALLQQFEDARRTASDVMGQNHPAAAGVTGRDPRADHDQRMAREIADLRAGRDEADRRVHLVLSSVQETVGQVADRLSRIEADLGEMRPNHLGPLLASSLAPIFAPRMERRQNGALQNGAAHAVGQNRRAGDTLSFQERERFGAENASPGLFDRLVPQQSEQGGESAAKAVESVDFLIEPGSGFRRRHEQTGDHAFGDPQPPAHERAGRAGRADFIAAARRAAQAAQLEASEVDSSVKDERGGRGGAFQKRALVLSIAALCLAVGAYALSRRASHVDVMTPAFLKLIGKAAHHDLPSVASNPSLAAMSSR